MTTMVDRARQLLKVHGVKQKDAAAAMQIHETAVSKIIAGMRGISADEFARLEAHVGAQLKTGFAEAPAGFGAETAQGSPVYPSRTLANGEWAVDLAAAPLRFALPPAPETTLAELFGFAAPDAAAWPRFKTGEIVWVSPSERATAGDDAFIVRVQSARSALRGTVGEFLSQTPEAIVYREFANGDVRQTKAEKAAVYRIAPRSD